MFNEKVILVTGGAGAFGRALVAELLSRWKPTKVIVLSRDEHKHNSMRIAFGDHPALRFFIGDICDPARLLRAFAGVDYVVHAAALKCVDTAEYNPFETVRINTLGTQNVIEAALDRGIKHVVMTSTDKAAAPVTVYGASKLCAERLMANAGVYAGTQDTRFTVLRYGNIAGSTGSIIPAWRKLIGQGATALPVTHPEMTRFWFTLQGAVDLTLEALQNSPGGEIIVPEMPSFRITDLAEALGMPTQITGIRAVEKLAEVVISNDEAQAFKQQEGRFVCGSSEGAPLSAAFEYRSDSNPWVLGPVDLHARLETV